MDQLKSTTGIIFTSANGVTFFWQGEGKRQKSSSPSSLKVCAIGPATADRLKKKRVSGPYIPKECIAESILEGFEKNGNEKKKDPSGRAKKARDVPQKG